MTRIDIDAVDWARYDVPIVTAALALMPVLFFRPDATYVSRLFVLVLLFAILAMALNIVFGHTDQLFLFVGALAGVGAYTTALTAESLGVSPWVTLVPGAVVVGAIGAVVCYVAARRRVTVIVIAILTLALQLAITEAFVGARDITGGSTGFRFSGLGLEPVQAALGVGEHVVLYYVLLALLAGLLVFYRKLMNSKYGMAFEMLRQDEVSAGATGIDVVRYKTLAGFVAAFVIGLAGPFYVQLEGRILPSMFEFQVIDVLVLIMLILGGLRTTFGPLVGAILVVYLNEQLGTAGQWRTVIFGFMLIVLFLYFRQGVVPFAERLLRDRLELHRRLGRLLGAGDSPE